MIFNGTLTDLQSRQYKDQTYYSAGVLDDAASTSDRLRTEMNVSIPADNHAALAGKMGSKVSVTLRLFKSVRNGLPEFDGRVVPAGTSGPK